MRKSRFSDEQITQVLQEDRNGVSIFELCRKHGISTNTFYSWRRKFGGLHGQEVRRLKELETTVVRLQRIVAKQALELEAAQEVIRGKW